MKPRLTIALLAGVALAVATGGAFLFVRYGARAAPDPRRVAVAPFEVFVPGLERWRIGLVEALSRKLDATGVLQAVPQGIVAQRWQGRATPVIAAVELGRQTGAGLAVYGRLDPAGGDSVQVRAVVLDVAAARLLFEIALQDSVGDPDRLADSLAAKLVRELERHVQSPS